MRRLGVIGITLLGLWTLVQSVISLVASAGFSASTTSDSPGVEWMISVSFLPAITLAALGALLVARRYRLAARLFDDEPTAITIDPAELARLSIILLGVATAITAIQGLAFSVLRPAVINLGGLATIGADYYEPEPLASYLPSILVHSLQLAVGLAIAWFAAPIARFLWTHERSSGESDGDGPARCPACGAAYDPADYDPTVPAKCTKCGGPLTLGGA